MSYENPLVKFDKVEQKFIDDLVHGKDEDVFVRGARNRAVVEKFGSEYLAGWLPLAFAYIGIKDTINNSEITNKEKVARCATHLVVELIIDAVRIGSVYGVYKLSQYSF